jgi:hypothetical protein
LGIKNTSLRLFSQTKAAKFLKNTLKILPLPRKHAKNMTRKNKLADLLNSLSQKEQRALHLFLQSTYHNKRNYPLLLYQYILSQKDYEKAIDSPETAFAMLFEDKSYDYKLLRRVIGDLTQAVLKFLKSLLLETLTTPNWELIIDLERRKLPHIAADLLQDAIEQHQKTPFRSFDYYRQANAIHTAKLYQATTTELQEHHIAQNNYTDILFIAEKLRLYCVTLSNSRQYNISYQPVFIDAILTVLEQSPELLNIPLIKVHYLVYQCFNFSENDYFSLLLSYLDETDSLFPASDKRNFYRWAENICALAIQKGNTLYLDHIFQLYEQETANLMIFEEDGSLRTAVFKNVVSVALRLHKIDAAQTFVDTHTWRLAETEREDMQNYCLAMIGFHRKDYEYVLYALHKIRFGDIIFKLNVRIWLLKTYYELYLTRPSYIDTLEKELNASRTFVYRIKQLAENMKEHFRNFIIFFEKLLFIPINVKLYKTKLSDKIRNTDTVAEKAWFLEKLQIS